MNLKWIPNETAKPGHYNLRRITGRAIEQKKGKK
jgi:hypothetical protein